MLVCWCGIFPPPFVSVAQPAHRTNAGHVGQLSYICLAYNAVLRCANTVKILVSSLQGRIHMLIWFGVSCSSETHSLTNHKTNVNQSNILVIGTFPGYLFIYFTQQSGRFNNKKKKNQTYLVLTFIKQIFSCNEF